MAGDRELYGILFEGSPSAAAPRPDLLAGWLLVWLHRRSVETVVMASDASRFSNPGEECLLAAVSLPRESVTFWAPRMVQGFRTGSSSPQSLRGVCLDRGVRGRFSEHASGAGPVSPEL